MYDLLSVMIAKKILSLAASTTKFIIFFFVFCNTYADSTNKKYYHNEQGILSLMYHRFDEKNYPSTNINMEIFKKHVEIINNHNFQFLNPKDFVDNFDIIKKDKKILLTIDDAFSSFYQNAWPYLKKNKIPFILFVSTEPVGRKGYMNWV